MADQHRRAADACCCGSHNWSPYVGAQHMLAEQRAWASIHWLAVVLLQHCEQHASSCGTHLALSPASRHQYACPDERVETHAVPDSSEHCIHLERVIRLQPSTTQYTPQLP